MSKANLSRAGSIWAGTLDALNLFLEGIPLQQKKMMEDSPLVEDNQTPELLQVVNGNTAIVNITGTLVTHATWFDSYIGRVAYPTIRNAVMYALLDPNIERILLMVDSGGGQVNGVSDLANFLTKAAKIKPMIAHTPGSMCSAAYWLASCATTVTASDTATVGSIGAVLIHAEVTEKLKEEGVNVTVIRSGPYKYIGNQYEKLSEDALQEMQGDINAAENIFVNRIAQSRGRGEDYVRTHMGQGRTFIGATAKDIGLVDAVYAYDDMMGKVLSGEFDKLSARSENTILGSSQMNVKVTDKATLQALAEQGINVDGVTAAQPEATKDVEGVVVEIEAVDTVEKNSEGGVEAEQDFGYTQLLEAKIEAKDEQIIELKVAAKAHAAELAALEASLAPLKDIVAQVTTRMAVGLGHSASDFSGLSAENLLAQHDNLRDAFSNKFKAGGVSAAQAQVKKPEARPLSARQQTAHKSTKLA